MPDPAPMPPLIARVITTTLRTGVLASAACCLIGAIVMLWTAHPAQDLAHFHGQPAHLTSPTAVLRSAASGAPDALAQLGILLLILTPLLRVLSALVLFILERDRLYVAFTIIVAGILTFGLLRGL